MRYICIFSFFFLPYPSFPSPLCFFVRRKKSTDGNNNGVFAAAAAPSCCCCCCLCGRLVMAAGRPEAHDRPPENGFAPLEQQPVPRLLPHVDASVLPSLGGFGRHQRQLVLLTWIPALLIGFSQFSDHFLLAQPNGTCVLPAANHSNWTASLLPPPRLQQQLRANNGTTGKDDGEEELKEEEEEEVLCACKELRLELQTGLSQNVVTKVTSFAQLNLLKDSPPSSSS